MSKRDSLAKVISINKEHDDPSIFRPGATTYEWDLEGVNFDGFLVFDTVKEKRYLTRYWCLCEKCNRKFKASFRNIVYGRFDGCPECYPKITQSDTLKYMRDNVGYILIYEPFHKYTRTSGFILYHRLVMERGLRKKEDPKGFLDSDGFLDPEKYKVHHIDGNLNYNMLINLMVVTASQHTTIHQRRFRVVRSKIEESFGDSQKDVMAFIAEQENSPAVQEFIAKYKEFKNE